MTASEVQAILLAVARLEGKVDGLAADNVRADALHADHETRLRGLEKVRWLIAGFFLAGSGVGAALAKTLGG